MCVGMCALTNWTSHQQSICDLGSPEGVPCQPDRFIYPQAEQWDWARDIKKERQEESARETERGEREVSFVQQ